MKKRTNRTKLAWELHGGTKGTAYEILDVKDDGSPFTSRIDAVRYARQVGFPYLVTLRTELDAYGEEIDSEEIRRERIRGVPLLPPLKPEDYCQLHAQCMVCDERQSFRTYAERDSWAFVHEVENSRHLVLTWCQSPGEPMLGLEQIEELEEIDADDEE